MVELAHVVAGPFAGMLLADLGADVVKIEGPAGDQMRRWPPVAVDTASGETFSHSFAALNRNKRSVVADLKSDSDRRSVRGLCDAADVVVENLRPGALADWGLSFEDLCRHRDKGLVYCSISGFGSNGRRAGQPAYDVVIQAMSGLMSATGTPSGEVVKSPIPVADFTSGLYAALAIAASIPATVGRGRQIRLDVPMLDCAIAIAAMQTSQLWGTGTDPRPLGTRHAQNAPYQAFSTRSGPIVIAAGSERLWLKACEVLGLPELTEDARFATQTTRVEHQDDLEAALNARLVLKDRDYWLEEFRRAGVPAGPINGFGEALADDDLRLSGFVRQVAVPVIGETFQTAFPVRAEGWIKGHDLPPPRLGQHADEVAEDWGRRNG